MDETIRVAILCGDEVIASTDDYTAVHISASLVASQIAEPRTAMRRIAESRRETLEEIAVAV